MKRFPYISLFNFSLIIGRKRHFAITAAKLLNISYFSKKKVHNFQIFFFQSPIRLCESGKPIAFVYSSRPFGIGGLSAKVGKTLLQC
ncbi:MAG: hypothetical protein MJZ08_01365 [Bacteroidaceae bacterium]|nr:hypothetical protein [Bacteroidaceae bacterium]